MIDRLLAHDPAQRYPTAAWALNALRAVVPNMSVSVPDATADAVLMMTGGRPAANSLVTGAWDALSIVEIDPTEAPTTTEAGADPTQPPAPVAGPITASWDALSSSTSRRPRRRPSPEARSPPPGTRSPSSTSRPPPHSRRTATLPGRCRRCNRCRRLRDLPLLRRLSCRLRARSCS